MDEDKPGKAGPGFDCKPFPNWRAIRIGDIAGVMTRRGYPAELIEAGDGVHFLQSHVGDHQFSVQFYPLSDVADATYRTVRFVSYFRDPVVTLEELNRGTT